MGAGYNNKVHAQIEGISASRGLTVEESSKFSELKADAQQASRYI
jgi:hypothetical protein